MPLTLRVYNLKTTMMVVIASVAITGCSKKATTAAPPADIGTNVPAVTTSAASANVSAPIVVQQSFAEVDAALKQKDYQKAAQTLLTVQEQKQLTDQQSQEARNRMIGLQKSLAQAIANGDPNAKAAGEVLRQSAIHH